MTDTPDDTARESDAAEPTADAEAPSTAEDEAGVDEGPAPDATCKCGFGLDHHFVSPRLKYSLGGWLWMFMGVNSMPTEVRFVCHQCDEVVYVTTDPDELEKHRMGGR